MDFLIPTMVTIFFLASCLWLKKKLKHFKDLGIPCVPAWPIVGNKGPTIFNLKSQKELIDEVYNLDPKALYVGFLDFMMRPSILVRDPELIRNLTTKNFDSFPGHPTIIDSSLDPLWNNHLFSLMGDKWAETRSVLGTVFTSGNLKAVFQTLKERCENCVNCLARRCDKDNLTLDTKSIFSRCTFDSISNCIIGHEVDSFNDFDNEFYKVARESINFEKNLGLRLLLTRGVGFLLSLFRIKLIASDTEMYLKSLSAKMIAEREKDKDAKKLDVVQAMLDARTKGSCKHTKFDLHDMTAQVFIMIFGGLDTTSTHMCIVAHLLAIHPEIQMKLQSEVDKVYEETLGDLSYDSLRPDKMPYLDAVMSESFRLYPATPMVDRVCVKEFALPPALPGLKPYVVKPGTAIMIPIAPIHRDPKFCEDNPLEFDPDRYMDGKTKDRLDRVCDMSFGVGKKACLGRRFATLTIKTLIFYLLRKFHLRCNDKTHSSIKVDGRSTSFAFENGFSLSIVPRK